MEKQNVYTHSGILLISKNKLLTYTTWINLKILYQMKGAAHKILHVVWLHLYEMSRKGILTEKLIVAWGEGWEP